MRGRTAAAAVGGLYLYLEHSPYYLYDQTNLPASYFIEPRNEAHAGRVEPVRPVARLQAFRFCDAAMWKDNRMVIGAGAHGAVTRMNASSSKRQRIIADITSIDNDHGDTTVLFEVTSQDRWPGRLQLERRCHVANDRDQCECRPSVCLCRSVLLIALALAGVPAGLGGPQDQAGGGAAGDAGDADRNAGIDHCRDGEWRRDQQRPMWKARRPAVHAVHRHAA